MFFRNGTNKLITGRCSSKSQLLVRRELKLKVKFSAFWTPLYCSKSTYLLDRLSLLSLFGCMTKPHWTSEPCRGNTISPSFPPLTTRCFVVEFFVLHRLLYRFRYQILNQLSATKCSRLVCADSYIYIGIYLLQGMYVGSLYISFCAVSRKFRCFPSHLFAHFSLSLSHDWERDKKRKIKANENQKQEKPPGRLLSSVVFRSCYVLLVLYKGKGRTQCVEREEGKNEGSET